MHGLDARTDVWGLGATLYDLLAGRPPFEGRDIVEIAEAVIFDDPPAPAADVPSDLSAIVQTCLEKEPSRRYADADTLADDLDRFLDGKGVTARPSGSGRRLIRLLGRRRGLVFAAGLSVVVAGAILAAAWGLLVRRGDDLSGAQRSLVDQMRAATDASMSAALELRRAGDVQGMRRRMEAAIEVCRRTITEAPTMAEAHFRLGRLLRAQMRHEEARACQDRALHLDPSLQDARYERILLTAIAHRRRGDERLRLAMMELGDDVVRGGRTIKPPSRVEATSGDAEASALLDRLDADIALLKEATPGQQAATGALRAWARGEPGAGRILAEACRKVRDLEELYDAAASQAEDEGRLETAIQARTEGIERDRGYLPHYEGRAVARTIHGAILFAQGRHADEEFAGAVADLTTALALDPERAETLVRRGAARTTWASSRFRQGLEVEDLFTASEADLTAALTRSPDHVLGLMERARLHLTRGLRDEMKLRDPTAAYEAAIADCTRILERETTYYVPWQIRGQARSNIAIWRSTRGGDSLALFEEALTDLAEALRRNSRRGLVWINRGMIRIQMALALREQGGDSAPTLREAVADFTEAAAFASTRADALAHRGRSKTELAALDADPRAALKAALEDFDTSLRESPESGEILGSRAQTYRALADACADRGENPGPWHEKAIADLDAAVRLLPQSAEALSRRGAARTGHGRWLHLRGGDPTALYDAADVDYAEALRRADEPVTRMGRAALRRNRGLYAAALGQDPEPLYRGALEDASAALVSKPRRASWWLLRGGIHGNFAAALLGRKKDPRREYEAALEDLNEAARISPASHDVLLTRAKISMSWGSVLGAGGDASAVFGGAVADLEAALKIRPNLSDTWTTLGGVRVNWANQEARASRDPTALLSQAIESFGRAVELGTTRADVWQFRGNAHLCAARWRIRRREDAGADYRSALEAYGKAIAIDGHLERALKSILDECRKGAGE